MEAMTMTHNQVTNFQQPRVIPNTAITSSDGRATLSSVPWMPVATAPSVAY